MSSDVAPNSIACAACAIIVPATLAIAQTPSTRSVFASAIATADSVTFPVCLDEVDLEGWKQCSCELETSYYNQQGEGCFRGMLRATARLALQ